MSIRWSLTNKKNVIHTKVALIKKPIFTAELDNPISFNQFKEMTENFQINAKDAFDAKYGLKISVLNSAKAYKTYVDESVQDILDAENKRKLILETEDIN